MPALTQYMPGFIYLFIVTFRTEYFNPAETFVHGPFWEYNKINLLKDKNKKAKKNPIQEKEAASAKQKSRIVNKCS